MLACLILYAATLPFPITKEHHHNMPPTLYLAITAHGFGHATRSASIVAKLQTLRPDWRIILVTTAPQWLLDSYLSNKVEYRRVALDIGPLQSDGINIDFAATLHALHRWQAQVDTLIQQEVAFIHANHIDLILGDIPPLLPRIAHAAKVPCWMWSNFGWDFIYRDWGGEFVAIADAMSDAYQYTDHLFRMPWHETMSAFPNITEVGFPGGTPRYSEAELCQRWQLHAPREKRVLMTFGGLGLQQIPYTSALAAFPDWQFITYDAAAPNLPNLVKITGNTYRPVDFMPFCRCLISKPGFSTFAEAYRLQVPIISITRSGFAEAELLFQGLRANHPHHIVDADKFFKQAWDFLHKDWVKPVEPKEISKYGEEEVAEAIVAHFIRPDRQ